MADAEFAWFGDEIVGRIKDREFVAVDETTGMAADLARANHPWENRTGIEEGSIMSREAYRVGHLVIGEWGAGQYPWPWPYTKPAHPHTGLPAIWLEYGTHHAPAKPFLRPAAALSYPRLVERLREF